MCILLKWATNWSPLHISISIVISLDYFILYLSLISLPHNLRNRYTTVPIAQLLNHSIRKVATVAYRNVRNFNRADWESECWNLIVRCRWIWTGNVGCWEALWAVWCQWLLNVCSAQWANAASFQPIHQTLLMKVMLTWHLQHSLTVQISKTNRAGLLFCRIWLLNIIFRFQVIDHKLISFFLLGTSALNNDHGNSWDDKEHNKVSHNLEVQCNLIELKLNHRILLLVVSGAWVHKQRAAKHTTSSRSCKHLTTDESEYNDWR